MEQQPGRRQGGRPPAGEGRPAGNRSPRPREDFVEDDPTMVRPFVKSGTGGSDSGGTGGSDGSGSGGGRRGRQGADGAAPGGGQGRQQPNGRAPEGGRGAQNGRGSQNNRNRQNGPGPDGGRIGAQGGVPGPRSPRDGAAQQVPGLLSTPMPAPRAVARNVRPEQQPAPYPEPDQPLSDLTTTMPILAVPAEDQYDDADGYQDFDNAAPGEHGHFHDDADLGRHRGRTRPPRALKLGAILAGVAVVGVAAYSAFGGSSGAPSAGPAAAGAATSTGAAAGAGTASDGATSAAPNTPAPTGTPTDSSSASTSDTKPTPSHSSKSPSKPSTSSHPSTSASLTSRPSSAPSTTASAPPPPPSNPSPTFTTLSMGSTGPAVTQLQQNLKSLGYGGWPPLRVNGNYDSGTQAAVQNFQDANPGTAAADGYGVYGPATDKAMQQALG